MPRTMVKVVTIDTSEEMTIIMGWDRPWGAMIVRMERGAAGGGGGLGIVVVLVVYLEHLDDVKTYDGVWDSRLDSM